MGFVAELAKSEVRELEPCAHGGEVWEAASERGVQPRSIIDFSANVNPLGPPKGAIEAIKKSLWRIPFYPDPKSTELREAISRRFKGIGPDNLVVGNGSTELIHLFAEVFVEKGDVALIPEPTFGEYEVAVRKAGGKPKHVKLARGFSVDPAPFLKEIKSGPKAIFLCNPNNPTGVLAPRETLLEIIEGALEGGALVFLDEDFIDFVKGGASLVDEVEEYRNLFVLRSFTKVYGLAGLRVGYVAACKEAAGLLAKAKTPWNVNCLAQAAALAALDDEGYLERTRRLVEAERAFLMEGLKRLKALKVFPASANFIFIDVRRTGLTAAQLKEEMLKRGILIRDCSSFRGLDEFYVRVAVRTRRENERLLEALREVVEGWRAAR